MIVKTDVSWVSVSSCSYTPRNSPLTFKVTVKSIILSSLYHQLLLPFKMLKSSLSHLPLLIQFSVFSVFKIISLFHPALLHLISFFSPLFIHFRSILFYFNHYIEIEFFKFPITNLYFSKAHSPGLLSLIWDHQHYLFLAFSPVFLNKALFIFSYQVYNLGSLNNSITFFSTYLPSNVNNLQNSGIKFLLLLL